MVYLRAGGFDTPRTGPDRLPPQNKARGSGPVHQLRFADIGLNIGGIGKAISWGPNYAHLGGGIMRENGPDYAQLWGWYYARRGVQLCEALTFQRIRGVQLCAPIRP